MARKSRKIKKEVRDGYLGDLPEAIQTKVMAIHKLVVETLHNKMKDHHYKDIVNTQWSKSMIDKFLVMPTNNSEVGSVRVYKHGKRYSCMIQLTGHVPNDRNDIDHELFHDMIRNTHISMRAKVRRLYDMKLMCESEHGEHFEGFDLWTKKKDAKIIWELFEGKKVKTVDTYTESVEEDIIPSKIFAEMNELPHGLQTLIANTNNMITESIDKLSVGPSFGNMNNSEIGDAVISENADGSYVGSITVSPQYTSSDNDIFNAVLESIGDEFYQNNPGKELVLSGNNDSKYFEFKLSNEYAGVLYEYLEENYTPYTESVPMKIKDINQNQNTDMSELEAKKTLRSLSQKIINDCKNNGKVTQYTANIYANIISKNLLPRWCNGFRKLSITLDTYQSFFTFEFKVPPIGRDFISRFINGRETINGFIRRNPEIKIKMSPRIFHSMKTPDDAFNFFKAAVKYYSDGLIKTSDKLMASAMKLNREMKHLISTTTLSGIISFPMKLLFVFEDVNMSNKDTFKISQEDINTVNQFMKNIYTRYAAPDKEKKKIVDDIKEMVKSLQESCELDDVIDLKAFPEAVDEYLFGRMDDDINSFNESWINEQLDWDWVHKQDQYEIKYLQEKFGVKKLKKIPADLVAYISIEAECIKDANDKMMIASYCLGKLEIVEWYIELLTVGSKKYIVPHTKPYLENVRTQLLACYKKIMSVKIVNPSDRPLIDIKYPKGYEG